MAKRERRVSRREWERRKQAGAEKEKEFDVPQGTEQGETGEEFGHVSVLLHEAMEFLKVRRGATYVDATLGLGGHSAALAARIGPSGRLICFDRDPQALQKAGERLARVQDAPAIQLVHAPFSRVGEFVKQDSVAGLLADFGVSSMQLDEAARGFSFRSEGPLDMRMDPQSGERTAGQVVNQLDERTLAEVIYEFGEERRSRRIARAIVRARPIATTAELAEVISAAAPAIFHKSSGKKIHPATKSFQAIRMFVNRELEEIDALLEQAPGILQSGGRLVAISFHSLEDRRVKDHMRKMAGSGAYRLLTKKPVTAGEQELERNARSRSAKLRAAEKI